MDAGGTLVVFASFGFEGLPGMEIPFCTNKLKDALFRFHHGVWEKKGSFGVMLDPWKS